MKIDHTKHGMKHGGPEAGHDHDEEKNKPAGDPAEGGNKPTEEPKADESK